VTKNQKELRRLRERVHRLTSPLLLEDLEMVYLFADGDREEAVFALPKGGGRFSHFTAKQHQTIGQIMTALGYRHDGRYWTRTLTDAELEERDGVLPPLVLPEAYPEPVEEEMPSPGGP